jgi:hypothetical protein
MKKKAPNENGKQIRGLIQGAFRQKKGLSCIPRKPRKKEAGQEQETRMIMFAFQAVDASGKAWISSGTIPLDRGQKSSTIECDFHPQSRSLPLSVEQQ